MPRRLPTVLIQSLSLTLLILLSNHTPLHAFTLPSTHTPFLPSTHRPLPLHALPNDHSDSLPPLAHITSYIAPHWPHLGFHQPLDTAFTVWTIITTLAGLSTFFQKIVYPASVRHIEAETKRLRPNWWPEIQSKLQPEETLLERPDLCYEIVKKLQPFMVEDAKRKMTEEGKSVEEKKETVKELLESEIIDGWVPRMEKPVKKSKVKSVEENGSSTVESKGKNIQTVEVVECTTPLTVECTTPPTLEVVDCTVENTSSTPSTLDCTVDNTSSTSPTLNDTVDNTPSTPPTLKTVEGDIDDVWAPEFEAATQALKKADTELNSAVKKALEPGNIEDTWTPTVEKLPRKCELKNTWDHLVKNIPDNVLEEVDKDVTMEHTDMTNTTNTTSETIDTTTKDCGTTTTTNDTTPPNIDTPTKTDTTTKDCGTTTTINDTTTATNDTPPPNIDTPTKTDTTTKDCDTTTKDTDTPTKHTETTTTTNMQPIGF